MRTASLICGLLSAVSATAIRAATPIPEDRRVLASKVGTIKSPADSPMHMPTDVAVDARGNIYVADGANDRLVRFNSEGRYDRPITQIGDQVLSRPVGLTVDARNRLWVADTGNHRILVSDPEGKLLQEIKLPKTEEKSFDPTDVAVTADGSRTYIVDNENHRLAIRQNSDGQFQFLGRFGEALGQFRWPFMVCIAPDGYVYVSEAIGARLQRLTPDDRWAGQVGRWGVEMGQLYRPRGLAISPRGQLFVDDATTGVVQIFTPRGALEGVLMQPDGQPLRFEHPMGMAFDPQGRLLVVELRADCVTRVELPPKWTTTAPEGGTR